MVSDKGLEPLRLTTLEPKSRASAISPIAQLEPMVGIEPTTGSLQNCYSTTELHRHIKTSLLVTHYDHPLARIFVRFYFSIGHLDVSFYLSITFTLAF